MNGKELVEQGLRLGIDLWRIEDELDWQENQGPGWAGYDVRKRRKPVVRRSTRNVAPTRQSAAIPEARGPGLIPGIKSDNTCRAAGSKVLGSR